MPYIVDKENHWHAGALGAPRNGPCRGEDGEIIYFGTQGEAERWLGERLGGDGAWRRGRDGGYSVRGVYVTSHGEYERPEYYIRFVRRAAAERS